MPATVTRDDVAARAKVSSATVSRVFNGSPAVSAATRASVLAAAKTLRYIPDFHASALRRNAGAGVLVVAEAHFLQGPAWKAYSWYWAEAVHAVQQALAGSPFLMELAAVDDAAAMRGLLQQRRIGGFLLNNIVDPALMAVAKRSGRPYVACGRDFIPAGVPRVISDERAGGRLAAERLRRGGLQRPAVITAAMSAGFRDGDASQQARVAGFREIYPEAVIVEGGYDRSWGEQAMSGLLPQVRAGSVDSVFCYNAWVAVGAAATILRAGLRIPTDVSLIAYDPSPLLLALPFRMATVDYRIRDIYGHGTAALLAALRGDASSIDLRLAPVLIEGDSVRSA